MRPILEVAKSLELSPDDLLQNGPYLAKLAWATAERLRTQSTLLEPVLPTPLLTRLVTSIDGALLLDIDGFCHAVGVILDGKSHPDRGTSTRGARFNSAIRYVESSTTPCLAVVVSEDGMVDIVTRKKSEE